MRHLPVAVDGVAVKGAAELIAHAARRHLVEAEVNFLQQRRVAAAHALVEQERQQFGVKELRLAAEAAIITVKGARPLAGGIFTGIEPGVLGRAGRLVRRIVEQPGAVGLRIGNDGVALVAPGAGDAVQHLEETRVAALGGGGEIAGGEYRHAVRRQDKQRRVAASPRHRQHDVAEMAVEIGALLAVDEDADIIPPERLDDAGIFQGGARQHMAPMTGSIAEGEENQLVIPIGRGQRFAVPGLPTDGVLGMRGEIGAGRIGKPPGSSGATGTDSENYQKRRNERLKPTNSRTHRLRLHGREHGFGARGRRTAESRRRISGACRPA